MNIDNGYLCNVCGTWVQFNEAHVCFSYPKLGYLQPISCNHCYCEPDKGQGTPNPHRRCCKCGDVMAEEFIK